MENPVDTTEKQTYCDNNEVKSDSDSEEMQPKRRGLSRGSKEAAMEKIKAVRAWETCSESSKMFIAAAEQFDEAFDAEQLSLAECGDDCASDDEVEESSSEYESSFIGASNGDGETTDAIGPTLTRPNAESKIKARVWIKKAWPSSTTPVPTT